MKTELSLTVRIVICALLVVASIAGFLATDLVLPAIPALPEILSGSVAEAQYVLAAFILGNAAGLLVFGAISWRFRRQHILIVSMLGFGLVSYLCTLVDAIWPLIFLRVGQGVFAAAPAVVAPGIIRQLFSEQGATRAIGALASLESLAPAIGPIIGLWLLKIGGWSFSFLVLTGVGAALGLAILFLPGWIPRASNQGARGSYLLLLRSPVYLRYALSQALVVGGMIVFVFCAPAMFIRGMGGTMNQFIAMQVAGVSCFIFATNLTGSLVKRLGAERVIWAGSILAAVAAAAILVYALAGGREPLVIILLFAPLNTGVGFRGPPGFLRAIIAGAGQDDRASSLMILALFGVVSGGTALLAPYVEDGLLMVALVVFALQALALALLWRLPVLKV